MEQAREKKQPKEGLYVLLRESLERRMEGFENSMVIKDRFNKILVEEAEGVKVKSRFKENMEKERGTLFHQKKLPAALTWTKPLTGLTFHVYAECLEG